MHSSNSTQKNLKPPVLRKRQLCDDNDYKAFSAKLSSVFTDIGEPSFFVDNVLVCSSDDGKTPYPRLSAQQRVGGQGFGGEADLNLINGHITDSKPLKISPDNFREEPDSPCWRIKVQDFGLGIVEVVATKQFEKLRSSKGGTRKSTTRDEMIPEQLERSQQRSKTQFRHKCLMLKVDRMLTLTYAENMQDREKAYSDFDKFLRRYKKETGESLEYIAVIEKQKRGAIHFHVGINKYINNHLFEKIWPHGFIRINKKAQYIQGGKFKKNVVAIALYLSKYMSKDIAQQGINSKRYSSSRGIAKPVVKVYFIPFGDSTFRLIGDIVMQENNALIGKILDFGSVVWISTYT